MTVTESPHPGQCIPIGCRVELIPFRPAGDRPGGELDFGEIIGGHQAGPAEFQDAHIDAVTGAEQEVVEDGAGIDPGIAENLDGFQPELSRSPGFRRCRPVQTGQTRPPVRRPAGPSKPRRVPKYGGRNSFKGTHHGKCYGLGGVSIEVIRLYLNKLCFQNGRILGFAIPNCEKTAQSVAERPRSGRLEDAASKGPLKDYGRGWPASRRPIRSRMTPLKMAGPDDGGGQGPNFWPGPDRNAWINSTYAINWDSFPDSQKWMRPRPVPPAGGRLRAARRTRPE